jgi:serine/threonine protein phosphatase PrpC
MFFGECVAFIRGDAVYAAGVGDSRVIRVGESTVGRLLSMRS